MIGSSIELRQPRERRRLALGLTCNSKRKETAENRLALGWITRNKPGLVKLEYFWSDYAGEGGET